MLDLLSTACPAPILPDRLLVLQQQVFAFFYDDRTNLWSQPLTSSSNRRIGHVTD